MLPKTKNIVCQKCQETYKVDYTDCIYSNDDQSILLKNHQFYAQVCPNCHQSNIDVHDTLYVDIQKRFIICLLPNFKEGDNQQEAILNTLLQKNNIDNDFEYKRLTLDHLQFVEKINILESHLDDRIIEIYKYLYKGKLIKDNPGINKILAYFTLDKQNAHLAFISNIADFHVLFDKNLYDQIYSDFNIVLTQDKEYLLIDEQWVSLFFERINPQGDI